MSGKVEYYTMTVYPDVLLSIRDLYEDLIGLAEQYVEESGLELTTNRERLIEYIGALAASPDHVLSVLRLGGETAGFAVTAIESSWSEEPLASLMLYYVDKPHRRHYAINALMRECERVAKASGAAYWFANTVSSISNRATRAFEMICMRHGMEPGSANYMKEF